MKYMCPNCGAKCLSHTSGTKIRNYRSVKTPPNKCPKCNTYISSAIELKAMSKRNHIIAVIIKFLGFLWAAILVISIIYSIFVKEIYLSGYQILYFILFVLGFGGIIILLNIFVKDKPKRQVFAVVDEDYQPLQINNDLKVQLKTNQFKHPNQILHDYATFDFIPTNETKKYPVLLTVALLNYKVKYYSLSFLGKRNGMKLPELNSGDSFTIIDCFGNQIEGSIECIFEASDLTK